MKILISILLFSLLIKPLKGQETVSFELDKILNEQSADFPKNKVFIKTDKDLYAPGEKIWFKAEVFNCLTESLPNETDLILMVKGSSGEVIVDQKYLIINGVVSNQITLPTWTPEGNAFLVAYTPNALLLNEASLAAVKSITVNQLRNNDYILNAYFNEKIYKPGDEVELTIRLNAVSPSGKREKLMISLYDYQEEIMHERVNVLVNALNKFKYKLPGQVADGLFFEIKTMGKNNLSQRFPVFTTDDRINVEFYPEGGHLLTNTIQRIVYRAIDPFGNPADVSGQIYDQLGNQAGVGKMLKPGLGLISLMPAPGQQYYFKIDTKQGEGQKFLLPAAIVDGCSFTLVKTEKEQIKASILNTGNLIGQQITLAAITAGQVYLKQTFVAIPKNNLQIACSDLPTGIVNFVVFDETGKLVSERMIFNTPNEDIDMAVQTHMKTSIDKGEVTITIDASNFIKLFGESSIDLKVVDEQNLFKDHQTAAHQFLKYPLLTSPPQTVLDIYITNIELIANNYRHFSLQEIFEGVNYLDQHKSKKHFSGVVTDKDGNPVPNATVMVLHANKPTLASTLSDENGRFDFPSLNKTKGMVVKAINETGKKTFTIHLDHTFDETMEELLMMESFKIRTSYSIPSTPEYVENNSQLLKLAGTETKDRKPRENNNAEMMLKSGASLLDVIRMIKPFSIMNHQIVFYGGNNSFLNQQGALIILDGQKMGTSIDALNSVNPTEVASINVSTEPIDIQQYTALNAVGIIEIRTHGAVASAKSNKDEKEEPVWRFDQEEIPAEIWKYQTTLLWQPDLQPDENGKASIVVKLNEIRSNMLVEVDIRSKSGISHRQTTHFETGSE
ncbi:MAG: carboxypeptidase regulatory-like domain-containing protein [Prolixibacteraceae bacterium]|nr:carboxypeptidase regulatory-like domain-containing protein [Prolixibacteraceae bacterium]